MSPEQLMAQRVRLDRRTDVYSLGVTLFECLTCHRPFEAPSRDALYQAIQYKDPPDVRRLNPAVPDDLKTVLEKALEKDRDRRYETALDFAEELQRVREYKPIHARPITPWIKVRRWAQRNPGVAASLALAFLFLATGLLAALILMQRAIDERGEKDRALKREQLERANVMRLSAFQKLESLKRLADEDLWPLTTDKIPQCERWLEDARQLTMGLEPDETTGSPGHRAQLAVLERRALPQTEEEREADRRSHARYEELETLKAKLAAWQRAQAVREGRERVVPFVLDDVSLPQSCEKLNSMAWPLVKLDRNRFGGERKGLALARRALARAGDESRHMFGDTLAWALFANGLDSEAVAASRQALEAAPAKDKRNYEDYLARLEQAILARKGEAGRELLAELESEIAVLEQEVSARRSFTFEGEDDGWWHTQVLKLISELEAFADERTGLMGSGTTAASGWGVERRLQHLRSARARLQDDAAAWEASARRVLENSVYGGLVLAPQFGLVPLGPDPDSGLEEYAHMATGTVPERDTASGKLLLTEETGILLVLLPGGSFFMGAQAGDPEGRNHDAQASDAEEPAHEVTLSAFFLSKYELTQHQWEHFTGQSPSSFGPGTVFLGKEVTRLHPVEQVSHSDCVRLFERAGLLLPTEAQWEYGCRAGTATPWCTGREREKLIGAVNLADQSAASAGATWPALKEWPGRQLEDGYTVHAPVGSYSANGFGLHDVHGNVAEWCLDWWVENYSVKPRPGDGLRGLKPGKQRVTRGGSFDVCARDVRSTRRNYSQPDSRQGNTGVRPARILEP
jgi:formylglycine-generating enzyme required for sulfatase activity